MVPITGGAATDGVADVERGFLAFRETGGGEDPRAAFEAAVFAAEARRERGVAVAWVVARVSFIAAKERRERKLGRARGAVN
jgi:hypothetical protein